MTLPQFLEETVPSIHQLSSTMKSPSLASALLLGLSTAAVAVQSPRSSPQLCNGYAAFCDRQYSNVTLIGAHDSAFVGPLLDPRVNQELNVTQQLDAGIRMFEAQTHVLNGVLSMCHTSCLELYAGTLLAYLTAIRSWIDGHPDDVVTLLLTNGDYVNVTMFAPVFEASGLDKYVYVPPTTPNPLPINEWPTYAELIADDHRLVAYLDYKADVTEVPYLLDEYQYFFDTPYDTTDPSFPECTLAHPPGASPDGRMYIVNHFLDLDILGIDIPDNGADYTTNNATGNGSIGAQAELCLETYGREPNFVLVDFFDRGDVFTAQDNLNHLS